MAAVEACKRLRLTGAQRLEQVLCALAILIEIGGSGKVEIVRTGHGILLSSPGVRIAG